MGFLGKLLTPKANTKRNVAREMGGTFARAPEGYTVVVSKVRAREVIFDIDAPGGPPVVFFGTPPATYIGIPYSAREDFTLELKRRGLVGQAIYDRRQKAEYTDAQAREAAFKDIQPHLTPPDFALGYGEFDYEFSIETNDEGKLRDLLADQQIRELLQAHRTIRLKVMPGDPWIDSLAATPPGNLAALYFQEMDIVHDIGRIKSMHELLARTMERLVELDVASPVPVQLFVDLAPPQGSL